MRSSDLVLSLPSYVGFFIRGKEPAPIDMFLLVGEFSCHKRKLLPVRRKLAAENMFGRPGNFRACNAADATPASDFVRR